MNTITASITEESKEASRWGGYSRTRKVTFRSGELRIILAHGEDGYTISAAREVPAEGNLYEPGDTRFDTIGEFELSMMDCDLSPRMADFLKSTLRHRSKAGIMRGDSLYLRKSETPVTLSEEEALAILHAAGEWLNSCREGLQKAAWNKAFPMEFRGSCPSAEAIARYEETLDRIHQVGSALWQAGYSGNPARVAYGKVSASV
jgi:hypothetical protein